MTALFLPSCGFAANYDYTYELLDHPDGSTNYRLTVSVTSSLYDYYRSKDHSLHLYDFAKFVTPSPLKPIADDLWMIYSDDEDFANGVLMIVHQIPYVESAPQKYPVETIVENEGDCDLFSFIAASVMKAGGLDVVLLLYEAQSHMNVGVHLSQEPEDTRTTIHYYSYEGKRYYVAECTGDDWRNGWRVGESPDLLKGASARIITLEGYEQSSPGQVSSSYGVLTSSSLSLAVSTRFVVAGGTVTMSGSISPPLPGKIVTLYVSSGGSPLSVLGTVTTDSDGRYSYTWSPPSVGIYSIRASWSGDADYAGADSNVSTVTVVPLEWLIMGVTIIVLLVMLLVVTIVTRRKPLEEIE
ncbi:MAG: Ig-like domain-containing protein, partial [Candidatus Bathyarchaeia archaeon]